MAESDQVIEDKVIEDKVVEAQPKSHAENMIELIMHIHSLEEKFKESQETIVNTYLQEGINVNPQALFAYCDIIHSKAIRMFITRKICELIGMNSNDSDLIFLKELDAIYSIPSSPSKVYKPPVVVGEK